eukprot:CAMPEP_0194206870 /NCGR_PEP_ID=MMETSP0156-20130528/5786_1 /TAXON_ID=33649 /ORGANISM="Thalassionema nitzschioides, Strain L26-B" /LENGTH=402 /DNA_ID=CAMNT_0038933501 /DNA_START=299 /DNA_END=1507 /DNA_ORIENTATION=+
MELPSMVEKGETCGEPKILAFLDMHCQANAFWTKHKICQYSCYQANRGYEGDVCCDISSSDFDENESPAASHVTANTTRSKNPLKVFLMVGQSNMQGHGIIDKRYGENNLYKNGTLEWLVEHYPDQFSKLKDQSGEWVERRDTWITYNRQAIGDLELEMHQNGNLRPGYGGDPPNSFKEMGPELGFGWTVGDYYNNVDHDEQQILLIKIAWGGRDLMVDYRPPSSGGQVGPYYESMIANALQILSSIEELFPEYASIDEYELTGFVWHQGWNDGCFQNMTEEYEYNLANLIRDVRDDLGVPNLPVSIGVSGFMGYHEDASLERAKQLRLRDDIINAQFAVAEYPEFAGTVASVDTRAFARTKEYSPGDQIYHWMNNCETYWLVGQAMGKAMLELLDTEEEIS